MRLNLYFAEHAGHTLKVWHDLIMCWTMQIDAESALVLRAPTRSQARADAHAWLHHVHEVPCTEALNWVLDTATRTVVLGECDECLSPNMVTEKPATVDGLYVRTCPECAYKVSFPSEMLEKMAR